MKYMYRGFLLPLFIIFSVVSGPFAVYAQVSAGANGQSIQDAANARQSDLQAQLDQAQKELDALNQQSSEIKTQKASIERDISLLDLQIKQAEAQIKVKTLSIQQ